MYLSLLLIQKIFALIENKDGGLFKSDDGGESWKRVNDDRNLRQRAWYYTRFMLILKMKIEYMS